MKMTAAQKIAMLAEGTPSLLDQLKSALDFANASYAASQDGAITAPVSALAPALLQPVVDGNRNDEQIDREKMGDDSVTIVIAKLSAILADVPPPA